MKGTGYLGRSVSALLIMLLALVAAISGTNHQAALYEHDILPSTAMAPSASPFEPITTQILSLDIFAASLSRNCSWAGPTPIYNFADQDLPQPDRSIRDFLFEHNLQPCWIGPPQSPGQGLTLNRVTSDTKVTQARVHTFTQHYRQSETFWKARHQGFSSSYNISSWIHLSG
jgi:hypothetical protein